MTTGQEIKTRARAAAARGDRAAAIADYQSWAAAAGSDKAVQSEIIEALLQLRAYGPAQDVARNAYAMFPESPAVAFALVRAHLSLECHAEANDVLRAFCERRPELAEAWEQWGTIAIATGFYRDAMTAFRGATFRRPTSYQLWNKLADAALADGSSQEAESAWRKSLDINPDQGLAAGQLGRLLLKWGQLNEARSWLEKSVASDRTLAASHMFLANVLLRQKQRKEALAAAEKAASLAPHLPESHATLGQVLLDLGWTDAAVLAFEKALALNARSVEALFGLANAHSRSGRMADAVAVLDRYLTLHPNDAQAVHMRRTWAREDVRSAPDDYVRRLFDAVAPDFEKHLQGNLGYNAPELAGALLHELAPSRQRFRSWCDVGCGTGLMAKALTERYTIAQQIGIDLAPQMLDQARAKGLYTDLIAGEAVAALEGMTQKFDLITAMDVLIYIGDGAPFLSAAAARTTPGGLVAVSLETDEDIEDVRLELTTRFVHNSQHFIGLARDHGLRCVKREDVALRRESGADVRGCILIFERA